MTSPPTSPPTNLTTNLTTNLIVVTRAVPAKVLLAKLAKMLCWIKQTARLLCNIQPRVKLSRHLET